MVARIAYFRTAMILAAMAVATTVTVLVGYGPASAQTDSSTPQGSGGPEVVKTVPQTFAEKVDRNVNIKVKFSEQMLASSIDFSTLQLYEGFITDEELNSCSPEFPCALPISPPVGTKLTYKFDKKLATLDWGKPLKKDTYYTVVVEGAGDSDGRAVENFLGVEMSRDDVFYFTTGDSFFDS